MANGALETEAIDKCIVQPAVIVERNAKYLLSQPGVNLFSAATVLKKKGGGSDSKRFGDRNRQPQNNAQLEAINTKLDKILAILEPTSVKLAEEPKIEKRIEIHPEKPTVVEKKTKASKKTAPTSEE